jgi:hypothetical protein
MIINSYPDKVVINAVILVKPYYMANTEFLRYALYQIKQTLDGRSVHIDALKNTPLNIAPYRGIVDVIVEELDLPPFRILLHIRDQEFSHPGVTVVPYNHWDERWRLQDLNGYLIGLENLPDAPDIKRFGCLFGRMQLGRLFIAHHLDFYHRDKSFVVFQCDKSLFDDQIHGIEEYFSDIREWWINHANPSEHHTKDKIFGEFNWPRNITSYPEVACQFQIEIVSETDYCSLADYTEKTWRCVATGKPFLSLNGAGSMAELRRLGFKTYDPLIDESYDKIDNLHERIKAIKTEINRLAAMDQQEWLHTLKSLIEIAMENRNFYRNWKPNIQHD